MRSPGRRAKLQAAIRRWRERNRTAVFDHYGWACKCCGSTDWLTIDHVAGDGQEHRAATGCGSGSGMYLWLVKNEFPGGFQTLCWPCNNSKKAGDRCRLDHDGQQIDRIAGGGT